MGTARDPSDFLENAPEALHEIGHDGTILWANRAELDLLGYEPGEYMRHHVAEFHVDEELCADILKRLFAGDRLWNVPARLRCKDGSVKHVLIDSNGHFEHGRFIHSRCCTRDVTELMEMQRQREMLAAIVESAQDAIIAKTLDGVIRSWNAGAERLFGYASDEAIGQSITIIIPAERHREEDHILERLRRGERIERYETVRVAKDGTRIDVALTISPLHDADGKIVGASKIVRDISDRKQAQIALRESEQRFTSFVRSMPGLAWIKAIDGRYVFANEAVQQPFGVSLDALYGKTDDELFPPETAAQFRANDRRALASGKGVQVIEALPNENGVRYSIVSKFPIPNAAGVPVFVGGVAFDITDRMRAESALKAADRRKDEFLATMGHELRNLLAPIRSGIDVLRMAPNSPAAARIYETIDRQITHMVRLLDDLLDLSRVRRGSIALQREAIDLVTLVRRALETSRPLVTARGQELQLALPDDPVIIEGDPGRLSQALANIVNNAAKYTGRGGRIAVTAYRERDEAVVSVRDSGIGIPQDMLTRVFDLFARVDKGAHSSTQEGLGVGLNLAKTLVEMHGGRIAANSEGAGHGSEFLVVLPVAKRVLPNIRENVAREEESVSVKQAPRIVVVDDDRDVANSLGMLLDFLGADARTAYDGPSALETVESFRPSIVIVDLGMPEMDGYEVARRIRQDRRNDNVLLVALTGWGREHCRAHSTAAGFDCHMVKPIDSRDLRALFPSRQGYAADSAKAGADLFRGTRQRPVSSREAFPASDRPAVIEDVQAMNALRCSRRKGGPRR